ncbi:SEC-C domain-containing protein [Chlorobium sp. N1]|uniref:SEC-C metal-binding domain-containing protein n=1 Tax=Chlorobium sp. N1 TaxID=2491138 RepID=UPI00103C7976|nr:SEC-C domain-containing protein [Chlorobium sp. N1]TCD48252.1 SEC-C domain-containing protein [Chlorobium sp. N1]
MNTIHPIPCPCGSGKPFSECCFRIAPANAPSPADEIRAAIERESKQRQFSSLEELQEFMNGFMRSRNQAPRDDFAGLSPEQMHRFLSFPTASPELVRFSDPLPHEPEAPATTIFKALAEAIGKKGLKPTATGNLPRAALREVALGVTGKETISYGRHSWNINKEQDYWELHIVRNLAELAGLVRKYRGRFILSRKCLTLVDRHGMAGVWPELLRTYATQFNWGYSDGYPAFRIIQQSFLFTLHLLRRFGEEMRPGRFYAEAFLRAFPAILQEAPEKRWTTPESEAGGCYLLRAMDRFAGFFGLAEVIEKERVTGEDPIERYRIRALPLLWEAVDIRLR